MTFSFLIFEGRLFNHRPSPVVNFTLASSDTFSSGRITMRLAYLLSLALLQIGCAAGPQKKAAREIETTEITYTGDGKKMIGFVAKPKDLQGTAPAVLVVHEWWGQTDYVRERAKMLAEQGYVAMAVDMFGERQIADHPKTAGEFAGAALKNGSTVRKRFNAALKAVQSQPGVDKTKVAAIGYCFGGSVVLEMAKQGADLKAAAVFHGGLKTPTMPKKGKVKANVAIYNGAADSFVPADQIAEFENSMTKAKANYTFTNYPDAKHGFTNPEATANGQKFGLPLAYNAKADQESWAAMLTLLQNNLK